MTEMIPVRSDRTAFISHMIEAWITSFASSQTQDLYRQTIVAFRRAALLAGIDLDGFSPTADLQQIPLQEQEYVLAALGLVAQSFALSTLKQHDIRATTYNNRLAVLSSFYRYVIIHHLIRMENPIDQIKRRSVQDYASARPLAKDQITTALAKIDKNTLAGKRDLALFLMLQGTGRRGREVRLLTWQDLDIHGCEITIHFHCKGEKDFYDTLEPRVAHALLTYLQAMFQYDLGQPVALLPQQPLWLSLSHKHYLQQISQRGLTDIFCKYFGITTLHSTRHTFALMMLQSGASVVEIMRKLGHSNLAVTSKYLNVLVSAENAFAGKILDQMGIPSW